MQLYLTTEVLTAFVGGQLEIKNERDGYLYRGEIAKAVVKSNELEVTFAWVAKGEGYPPIPTRWVEHMDLSYQATLDFCSVNDIGPGTEGSNRICLLYHALDEVVVFFPPDGSKLDRSKVEKLV